MLIKAGEVSVGDLVPGDVYELHGRLTMILESCELMLKDTDRITVADLKDGTLMYFTNGDCKVKQIHGSYSY